MSRPIYKAFVVLVNATVLVAMVMYISGVHVAYGANYSGTALFVVGNTTLSSTDQELNDRIGGLGYTVTAVADDDAFLDTDANWETFDVAIVSESVASVTLGTSGRDAAVGVVMLENGLVDDWDLASSTASAQESNDCNIETNHPVAAGLAGGPGISNENIIATENKQLRFIDDASSGANEICTAGNNATLYVLVSWDSGAALTSGNAADRRVYIGWFRLDTSLPGGGDESAGFVVNDTGWAIFDASVDWAAGLDLDTARQIAVPSGDTLTTGWVTTGGNYFGEIDDDWDSLSTSDFITTPDDPSSDVAVFSLSSVTDPANTTLHQVAVGWRRAGGNRSGTLEVQLREGYVSEASLGTLIATTTDNADTGTDWGGAILQLSTAEINSITDYGSLFVRLIVDVSGGSETTTFEIASIRFIVDGGVASSGGPGVKNDPQVVINGFAYPRAIIDIEIDGKFFHDVARNNGVFSAISKNLNIGRNTIAISAVDILGLEATPIKLSRFLKYNQKLWLANIFLPPTIELDEENNQLHGSAYPEGIVKFFVDGSEKALGEATVSVNGFWEYSTENFEPGEHMARVQSVARGFESPFSEEVLIGGNGPDGFSLSELLQDLFMQVAELRAGLEAYIASLAI